MIVHLNVPDSVIMARITARWVHLPSGRVYNTSYSAPMVEGIDDVTGEPLTKRPDDTPVSYLLEDIDGTDGCRRYSRNDYRRTINLLHHY
jgi:hypothetical protein